MGIWWEYGGNIPFDFGNQLVPHEKGVLGVGILHCFPL